eukprot:TRINITY_DN9277_c1_g3_i1.p1 TRINITY_DN9277_c1_g3~~TRINITY_DN9277_c1_g3_i1.p1  ORF type:complete len:354 (+),score=125.74 TRINITY_DN9277_c1_g3_i1:210-1271(+)
MATPDEDLPDAFKCGITGELMRQPVVTIYGDYFERNALLRHLEKHNTCPLRRKPLARHNVWLEPSLAEAIREYRAMCVGANHHAAIASSTAPLSRSHSSSPSALRRKTSREEGLGGGGGGGSPGGSPRVLRNKRKKRRSSSFKKSDLVQAEPEIKYYNHQLLNRREPASTTSGTPTRSSLSSSTFAAKLLKAASRSPDVGRTVHTEGKSVQWLWRDASSWQIYRSEDNMALEESLNRGSLDESVFVDQGHAFVNVSERVHVSLANGRRFRVLRGTWFLGANEGNQVLPLEEHVAAQLERCFAERRVHERVGTEMGTVIVMEDESHFTEYLVEGDALYPTKRRVERGFCFQSIT